MTVQFNNQLRQVLLLLLIILLALLLLGRLYAFLPGFLGAITLYILLRTPYFNLTFQKKWNKTGTAVLFIIASLILIAIPIYFSIELLTARISAIISNPADIMEKTKLVLAKFEQLTGYQLLNDENLHSLQQRASNIIPGILNSSASILSNFAIMFFLLYFMLKNGVEVEKFLQTFIPLKPENISLLSRETKNMIRANAIGIPVMAIFQGLIATVGYSIFGVREFALWGFITGVCSMIPLVGTALVWVPLVAYYFATGNNNSGTGLLIYSLVLITNIDYLIRLTILRKMIDVHPLITIFGVIVGIGLFGFWGVIFGPLLISYFIVLVKIYMNEFGSPNP